MGRGDLAANAGLPLGHDGEAEAGDEHPFIEQQLAHPDGGGGLAQDHGDDRRFPGQRLEAERAQLIAEVAGVLAEPRDPLRARLERLDAGEALAATVGGSALEKSCGRARWVR